LTATTAILHIRKMNIHNIPPLKKKSEDYYIYSIKQCSNIATTINSENIKISVKNTCKSTSQENIANKLLTTMVVLFRIAAKGWIGTHKVQYTSNRIDLYSANNSKIICVM